MTATAVVPTTTAPAASRAVATGPREPSASAELFDRQLHAARQQHEPAHDSVDASSPKPVHKPAQESSREPEHKPVHAAKGDHAAADALPSKASPDSDGAATTPLTGEAAAAGVADSQPADPGRDTKVDGDQAGAALAGSMLALLGLSSGVAFVAPATTDGGATTAAGSGKTVTTDANVVDANSAASLRANALDSGVAATAAGTIFLSAGTQPAGDDPGPAIDKVVDHTDLTSLAALPAAATTGAPMAAHPLQLPASVGSPAFAHELSQQVVWLTGQDVKQARIRLHPEELGPLDVKIDVSHDRVDVVFNAQHPAAVTAIQQSLSQLGQMLTQQGLSLGHAEVGGHDRGENQGHAGAAPNDVAVEDADEVHGIGLRTSIGTAGLLDAFA